MNSERPSECAPSGGGSGTAVEPSGWRRKDDTALPAVYAFTYHRLIIDEVHTLKNPKIPWCACHAELAKLCEKRVGMSATLVQSSMSDLAGEAKTDVHVLSAKPADAPYRHLTLRPAQQL